MNVTMHLIYQKWVFVELSMSTCKFHAKENMGSPFIKVG